MLSSDNLQLRALEPEDIDLLYEWENDSRVWQLSNTQTPFSRFALEQYVLNAGNDIFTDKQLRLMIDLVEGENKRCIGCVDLFDFDPAHARAGIGIMIISEERGKNKLVFVESALIFEANMEYLFDYILLITSEEDIRIKRILERGRETISEIRSRMLNQIPESEKKKRSQFIIENNSTIKNLEEKTLFFLNLLKKLAER